MAGIPKLKNRLESLDILRGLDLFCLVFLQPVLWRICEACDTPFCHAVWKQIDHAQWAGFHAWDIIMPLFLFMSGITIPFAYAKYKGKQAAKKDTHLFFRLFKRILLLFAFGWIVQGNLLSFDIHQFRVFSNTLQAIAVGYLVATLLFLFLNPKFQITTAFLLLTGYWAVFFLSGSGYEPTKNIAYEIDKAVLGQFMDGVYWNDGNLIFSNDYTYTWILSSLNFIVTVQTGVFAGLILRSNSTERRNFRLLSIIGILLICAGLLLSLNMPIIKRIWSSSMTLFSSGICFLLMALLFYTIDIKKWRKPFSWLKIYGMNSITAYVLYESVNFRCIGHSLFHGLQSLLGMLYPALIEFSQGGIVFLILYLLYRNNRFIKI